MSSFVLDPILARDTTAIGNLALCEVRLMLDATYPWLVLIPRRADLREILDLSASDAATLMDEIRAASAALQAHCSPLKLNVAALGNQVAQLHIHVIARSADDPAWPKPVWGAVAPRSYDANALAQRIQAVRKLLQV